MAEKKMIVKIIIWFSFTIIIGLVPFLARLFIFDWTNKFNFFMVFSISDFATLGLVICASIFSELSKVDKNLVFGELLILFIFAFFYGIAFVLNDLNTINIIHFRITIALVISTFIIGVEAIIRINIGGNR